MEPSIYLIKVNVALIVLYAFYKFSFSKDTFFRLRRGMLLLICATSLIYPFIDFSEWAGWNEHALGEAITTVYNKLLPEVLVTATYLLLQQKLERQTGRPVHGCGLFMDWDLPCCYCAVCLKSVKYAVL